MMVESYGYILSISVIYSALLFNSVGSQQECSPDGTCFTWHSTRGSWESAEDSCVALGGHLASISNIEQQLTVRTLVMKNGGEETWIGASHSSGVWRWIGTNAILLPQGCYSDVDEQGKQDMFFKVPDIAQLNPEACISECEMRGYQYAGTQGGRMCYCDRDFGSYGTNKVCTRPCPAPSNISSWCGGMLMNFVYRIDGAYGSWGYHQPNDFNKNQNCGILDTAIETKMADEDCLNNFAYMCEILSKPCPTVPDPEYYSYQGRCFYFNEQIVSWAEAETDCEELGGILVVIDSSHMHEIVRNVTTILKPKAQKFWIGLRKSAGWSWTAVSDFYFTSWASGYPKGADTCVAMDSDFDHSWVDRNCNTRLPYICQSEIPTLSTTSSPGSSSTESLVGPGGPGAATQDEGLTTVEIVLAVMLSLLGLILLALLIALIVIARKKSKENKIHIYDARPIAPIPNSGEDYDSYYNKSTEDLWKPSPYY